MALIKLTNGTDADADKVMDNFNKAWSFNILNKIRQNIDRVSVVSSGQDDIFTEAYVDVNGQNNSVNNKTIAIFDTDKYKVFETIFDPSTTNIYWVEIDATNGPSNGDVLLTTDVYSTKIDENKWIVWSSAAASVEANKAKVWWYLISGRYNIEDSTSVTSFSGITSLKSSDSNDAGKTWYAMYGYSSGYGTYVTGWTWANSAQDVKGWYAGGGSSDAFTYYREYDWSDSSDAGTNLYTTPAIDVNPTGEHFIKLNTADNGNFSYSMKVIELGTGSISITTGTENPIYINTVGWTLSTEQSVIDLTTIPSIIEHDIPSGTYPSNISKLIGKVLYADWESGVSIQHKLKNATEDSGWINDGELGTFTAFTSEPTQYVVKLIPRSTSPTSGYPSIKGAGFYTE